ncbi:MAG: hypothetical protein IPP98_13420 [Gemmatimonadetes bacterium]|nr:hypothetical protein [Gemmatimonadota bacterium]
MRVLVPLLLGGALAACSALPADSDGVVAIEVRTQSPVPLPLGQQVTLRARALNQQGDSVPSVIRWYTADTALLVLDSTTGVLSGRAATGTARVQAAVGTLRSDPISITLLPAVTGTGRPTP